MDENNPHSCDQARIEALENLEWSEPGLESIVIHEKYFSKVDDRLGTNNYCQLIQEATKKCQKMSNAKLWLPLHAQTNLDKLADQLEFDWPMKVEKDYRHMKSIFNEIEENFERKGLKSTLIPGVKQYESKRDSDKSTPNSQQTHNHKSFQQYEICIHQ